MSVFAVHPLNDKDITPALVYGDLVYVNHRYVYGDELDDAGHIPPAFTDKMWRAAEKFDPDKDFLLIAGDHLQLVALSSYITYHCPYFRVLRFDRHAGGYISVLIESNDEGRPHD